MGYREDQFQTNRIWMTTEDEPEWTGITIVFLSAVLDANDLRSVLRSCLTLFSLGFSPYTSSMPTPSKFPPRLPLPLSALQMLWLLRILLSTCLFQPVPPRCLWLYISSPGWNSLSPKAPKTYSGGILNVTASCVKNNSHSTNSKLNRSLLLLRKPFPLSSLIT